VSYDLNFWKERPGVELDPQSVYERLSEGEIVDGLEVLPIERIVERIAAEFSQWERLGPYDWESPGQRGSFQVATTPQSFRVDCYGMYDEDMNRVIDIGHEFGCPLYDPQTGERYGLGGA
jgi:hypothetical protein